MLKRLLTIIKYAFIFFVIVFIIFGIYFYNSVVIDEPYIVETNSSDPESKQLAENFYRLNNSWLKKSNNGLWEMYVEGDPYERGVAYGKLSINLIKLQEKYFVDQLNAMIPSQSYLGFLKYFVAWFNRDVNNCVDDEFKQEIYGVSRSASSEYDYIGPKYQRMLYYHAAHDIGHALLNMHLVGCTSFSIKNTKSDNGELIVGRNFDFYMGDDFSRDKIVAFYNPTQGYKFMFITWGGMTGVVSGMNEKGVVVTINAAEGEMPISASVPISIIVREVLQYSKNIDDAIAITKKRKSFVSESIMVTSAIDNKTIIIEKTPERMDIYDSNSDIIISTNHFQNNRSKPAEQSSLYRYNRVSQMMDSFKKMGVNEVALILRDHKGLNETDIGLGNEKSINQFIAHHSVIFKPKKLLVWISTSPYPSGKYYAYNLKEIFSKYKGLQNKIEIYDEHLTIKEDPFVKTKEYNQFVAYKKYKDKIVMAIAKKQRIDELTIGSLIVSNPQLYSVYQLLGDYYYVNNDYINSANYYKIALTKEIARVKEKDVIQKSLLKSLKKIQK